MTQATNEQNRGEVTQVGAVQFQRELPGSLEKVWSYLTDCRKLPQWFGDDGHIEGCEGGKVWLMGGHIRGVVTQWKPHRKLAYTWNVFDPGDDESHYPESYLLLELKARGDQTLLNLLHLPIPESFDKQTRMGWHTFLDIVEAGVSGANPQPRENYMQRNAELYDVDMNNLTK